MRALSDVVDQPFTALARLAALDHAQEVTLTDQMLAELAVDAEFRKPAQLELCFQLHAPDREAAPQGAFTLVVIGLSGTAGTSAGRFLGLLPSTCRERLVRTQVSSPPLHTRTENVSRAPAIWPVISLGEYDSQGDIPLRDLAVTTDGLRLRLVSISTGRTVEPVMLNAVEAASGKLYPVLARLERAGWLTKELEQVDPAVAGRPARRLYRITEGGVRAGSYQLAALSERWRPPAEVLDAPLSGTACDERLVERSRCAAGKLRPGGGRERVKRGDLGPSDAAAACLGRGGAGVQQFD